MKIKIISIKHIFTHVIIKIYFVYFLNFKIKYIFYLFFTSSVGGSFEPSVLHNPPHPNMAQLLKTTD